jgi:hypothetical protein
MLEAFKAYFHQIKSLDVGDSTEHTFLPALALRFRQVSDHLRRGKGRTLRHSYTFGDYSFDRYWEVLEG